MSATTYPFEAAPPSLEVYLLGRLEYDVALALQNRLVYEVSGRNDGQMALLLCEHPATLTVGRRGSRAHIGLTPRELASRNLLVRWVNHGGGCLVHAPGQLAVYPIIPLQWHNLALAAYLTRLRTAIRGALEELKLKIWDSASAPGNGHANGGNRANGANGTQATRRNGTVNGNTIATAETAVSGLVGGATSFGLWGRTGQLAAFAVAVKHGITYHGAFVNVCPDLDAFRGVSSDPMHGSAMSSLVAERQQPVRMTTVREAVVRHICQELGCGRFHIHTGHPLLPQIAHTVRESARVG